MDGEGLDSLVSVHSSIPLSITEEEIEITPDEVLSQMRIAWQNECASPCLLPHRFDLVECLIDQNEGIEENLALQKDRVQLRTSIHRLELHRLIYLTNDYMRTRLKKIEQNARGVLREHNNRVAAGTAALLSEQEKKFAERFAVAIARLMGKVCLGRLQPSIQKIPVPREDFECERVYVQALEENIEAVMVPDYQDRSSEIIVQLEKDSVHLLPFLSVQNLLEKGTVRLL